MMADSSAAAAAVLTINLDAIRANWRLLSETVRPNTCGGVVKANAYGLGAVQVARAMYEVGCRDFFVALVDEGVQLRPALPDDAVIYVLQGPLPGAEYNCLKHGLIPVLNALDQLERWHLLAQRAGCTLDAALQFDTGMARLGLSATDVALLEDEPERLDCVNVRLVMSHLVSAEVASDPVNLLQLNGFAALRKRWPQAQASLANSSGIFLGEAFHFDLARPGAALYGVAPSAGPNPMRPVVKLQGRLIQWRAVEAGSGVGYNHTWRSRDRRRIGTISVGYADGILRNLSNRAHLRFKGKAVPLVGRVSMDTVTVDVTEISETDLTAGTLFDILDDTHDINALADEAGTNAYEILTSLGARYLRR